MLPMGQVVVLALLGGLPYVVWGFVIRMLVTMHMTWFVNSAVHIWGRQTYDTNDSSSNNWCERSHARLLGGAGRGAPLPTLTSRVLYEAERVQARVPYLCG